MHFVLIIYISTAYGRGNYYITEIIITEKDLESNMHFTTDASKIFRFFQKSFVSFFVLNRNKDE